MNKNRGNLIYNDQTNQQALERKRYLSQISMAVIFIVILFYICIFDRDIRLRIIFGLLGLVPLVVSYLLIAQFVSMSSFKVYEKGFIRPTQKFPIRIDLETKFIPYNIIEKIVEERGHIQVHLKRRENKEPIKFPVSALNIPIDRFIELLESYATLEVSTTDSG